ncbi:MAG: hypothetical protein QXD69_05835, partial [Candidatus Bathyarchaeia archaeon]
KTINYAYEKSAFYKRFYDSHKIDITTVHGLRDLERIPIFRKTDLLRFLEQSGSMKKAWCITEESKIDVWQSSGTSFRIEVPYTENDKVNFLLKPFLTGLRWWGYASEPINTFAIALTSNSSVYKCFKLVADATGGTFFSLQSIQEIVKVASNVRGKNLTLTSISRLEKLIDCFREFPMTRIPLHYIFAPISPVEMKERLHTRISKMHKVNIIPFFGATETLLLGFACPYTADKNFCHVFHPGLVRIMNSDGSLSEEGKGELIYTSLGREAFPFINYGMEDLVTLRKEICRCGFVGSSIRFERRLGLRVKVPYPTDYFIDIGEVVRIIKELIPGSQVLSIYGQHPKKMYFFLAFFIGIPTVLTEDREKILRNQILERILVTHSILTPPLVKDEVLREWRAFIPVFFLNLHELPLEPDSFEPRILVNLMDRNIDLNPYNNLLGILEKVLDEDQ